MTQSFRGYTRFKSKPLADIQCASQPLLYFSYTLEHSFWLKMNTLYFWFRQRSSFTSTCPSDVGLPMLASCSVSASFYFIPSHHLSSRCHIVDKFNQKIICHCLRNTLRDWDRGLEHPVLWHTVKTIPWMHSVCKNILRKLCQAPQRSRSNENSKVNTVVPVEFVIYNSLSMSASGDLDYPLDSKDSQRLPDAK